MSDKPKRVQKTCSYEYDADADALYVYLRPGLAFARTVSLDGERLNVDLTANGEPIGYEVLGPNGSWMLSSLLKRVPALTDDEMQYLAFLSAQRWSPIMAPTHQTS